VPKGSAAFGVSFFPLFPTPLLPAAGLFFVCPIFFTDRKSLGFHLKMELFDIPQHRNTKYHALQDKIAHLPHLSNRFIRHLSEDMCNV
jgi:hypothetical protein